MLEESGPAGGVSPLVVSTLSSVLGAKSPSPLTSMPQLPRSKSFKPSSRAPPARANSIDAKNVESKQPETNNTDVVQHEQTSGSEAAVIAVPAPSLADSAPDGDSALLPTTAAADTIAADPITATTTTTTTIITTTLTAPLPTSVAAATPSTAAVASEATSDGGPHVDSTAVDRAPSPDRIGEANGTTSSSAAAGVFGEPPSLSPAPTFSLAQHYKAKLSGSVPPRTPNAPPLVATGPTASAVAAAAASASAAAAAAASAGPHRPIPRARVGSPSSAGPNSPLPLSQYHFPSRGGLGASPATPSALQLHSQLGLRSSGSGAANGSAAGLAGSSSPALDSPHDLYRDLAFDPSQPSPLPHHPSFPPSMLAMNHGLSPLPMHMYSFANHPHINQPLTPLGFMHNSPFNSQFNSPVPSAAMQAMTPTPAAATATSTGGDTVAASAKADGSVNATASNADAAPTPTAATSTTEGTGSMVKHEGTTAGDAQAPAASDATSANSASASATTVAAAAAAAASNSSLSSDLGLASGSLGIHPPNGPSSSALPLLSPGGYPGGMYQMSYPNSPLTTTPLPMFHESGMTPVPYYMQPNSSQPAQMMPMQHQHPLMSSSGMMPNSSSSSSTVPMRSPSSGHPVTLSPVPLLPTAQMDPTQSQQWSQMSQLQQLSTLQAQLSQMVQSNEVLAKQYAQQQTIGPAAADATPQLPSLPQSGEPSAAFPAPLHPSPSSALLPTGRNNNASNSLFGPTSLQVSPVPMYPTVSATPPSSGSSPGSAMAGSGSDGEYAQLQRLQYQLTMQLKQQQEQLQQQAMQIQYQQQQHAAYMQQLQMQQQQQQQQQQSMYNQPPYTNQTSSMYPQQPPPPPSSSQHQPPPPSQLSHQQQQQQASQSHPSHHHPHSQQSHHNLQQHPRTQTPANSYSPYYSNPPSSVLSRSRPFGESPSLGLRGGPDDSRLRIMTHNMTDPYKYSGSAQDLSPTTGLTQMPMISAPPSPMDPYAHHIGEIGMHNQTRGTSGAGLTSPSYTPSRTLPPPVQPQSPETPRSVRPQLISSQASLVAAATNSQRATYPPVREKPAPPARARHTPAPPPPPPPPPAPTRAPTATSSRRASAANAASRPPLPEPIIINTGAKKTATKFYPCSHEGCSELLKTRFSLKRHMKKHTGEKPHVCPYESCGKSFPEASTLKRHLRIHTGEKPFKCSFHGCQKAFADATNVKRHEMTHTGEKPYRCLMPNCPRSFSRGSSLRQHMISLHHLESDDPTLLASVKRGRLMKMKKKRLKANEVLEEEAAKNTGVAAMMAQHGITFPSSVRIATKVKSAAGRKAAAKPAAKKQKTAAASKPVATKAAKSTSKAKPKSDSAASSSKRKRDDDDDDEEEDAEDEEEVDEEDEDDIDEEDLGPLDVDSSDEDGAGESEDESGDEDEEEEEDPPAAAAASRRH